MPYLLDTHTFLWYIWGDQQLSNIGLSLIEDSDNRKFVSIVSLWEIAIKVSIGKLTLAKPVPDFLKLHLDGNGFEILAMERAHIEKVATLPFHHKDPFDRLLIAQSLSENMPLVSADVTFDAYGVQRRW